MNDRAAAERRRGRKRKSQGGIALALFGVLVAIVVATECKREPPTVDVIAPPSSPDAGPPNCGVARESPRGLDVRTASGRTFHVWGPPSYDPAHAYPVLFTFHGWDSNGRDFEKWFKMEDHVKGEAFVVYPDSLGPRWDLAGDREIAFFDEMRAALIGAWCIDPQRLYALGFSYGGKLVNHLACRRAGILRAASVGDGSYAYDKEGSCARLPMIFTHRTVDHDEKFSWGRDAAQIWSRIDRCKESTHATDAAHGCFEWDGCEQPVAFCEDKHTDKSWPEEWNHTIREEYRDLTWSWLSAH